MLRDWLRISERNPCPYQGFSVVDVQEEQPPTADVKTHLSDLLRNARLDPGFLKTVAGILGWDEVGQWIGDAFAEGSTARRGQFGEVLSSGALNQFHGYTIPVEKLRFAVTAGQSQPGVDLVAVKCDSASNVEEVCFVESKLRTSADTGAALQAYQELRGRIEKHVPAILLFVATVLHHRGDYLFGPFLLYLRDRQHKQERDSYRLFLTYERAAWSETTLGRLEDEQGDLDPLAVHVAQISNLRALTDEVFEEIGIQTLLDDE